MKSAPENPLLLPRVVNKKKASVGKISACAETFLLTGSVKKFPLNIKVHFKC